MSSQTTNQDIQSPETSFEAVEWREKARWKVSLHPESLVLEAPDGAESITLLRSECEKNFWFRQDFFGAPRLTVWKPRWLVLKLDKAQLGILKKWYGPPNMKTLEFVLERRFKSHYAAAIMAGIVLLVLTLSEFIGLRVETFTYRVVSFFVALMGFRFLSASRPRPFWYLLQVVWFMSLAAYLLFGVHQGHNPLWLLLLLIAFPFVTGSLSDYRYFRGVRRQEE